MKRIVYLFLLGWLVSFYASAQNGTGEAKSPKFIYCELVETRKVFTSKVTIIANFGDEQNYWKPNRIKDEMTGKVRLFNSIIDALNYMGENGWELVQTYPITYTKEQNTYHWVLKKPKE